METPPPIIKLPKRPSPSASAPVSAIALKTIKLLRCPTVPNTFSTSIARASRPLQGREAYLLGSLSLSLSTPSAASTSLKHNYLLKAWERKEYYIIGVATANILGSSGAAGKGERMSFGVIRDDCHPRALLLFQ